MIKHLNIRKLPIVLFVNLILLFGINLSAKALESDSSNCEEIKLEIEDVSLKSKIDYDDRIALVSPSIAGQLPFSPLMTKSEDSGVWARPFLTFEKVRLNDGTVVNNTAYGNLFGLDSDLKNFDNRFDYMLGLYGGYSGARLSYDGVVAHQNGGFVGGLGVIYKGNFFTAMTTSFRAAGIKSNSSTDFAMISPEVSSRTGYNIKILNDKVTIQPNYSMSYSFVGTQSYTDEFSGRVPSSQLHIIQIAPSVRIIGNLKNNWEPYLSVAEIWTMINHEENILPSQAAIPQLAIEPYAEYGAGVQKKYGENFVGFIQAMARSGGRSGVAFLAGLWWRI